MIRKNLEFLQLCKIDLKSGVLYPKKKKKKNYCFSVILTFQSKNC